MSMCPNCGWQTAPYPETGYNGADYCSKECEEQSHIQEMWAVIEGQRFLITDAAHPFWNRVGRATKVKNTLSGQGLILTLDDGRKTMVFSSSSVRKLDES